MSGYGGQSRGRPRGRLLARRGRTKPGASGELVLRSTSDRDTHRGELHHDGTVVAQCGIRFPPRPLPFDRIALPSHPQDRARICPQCRDRTAVAAGGDRAGLVHGD